MRQLGNDGTAVLVGQIGIQNAPFGLAPHDQANDPNGHKQHDTQRQSQALALVQPGQALGDGGLTGIAATADILASGTVRRGSPHEWV